MANRKTRSDYKRIGSNRGFSWVGEEEPESTLHITKWMCGKGHLFTARYADIYWGRGCPECSLRSRKTDEDYRRMARAHGITYVGPLPHNRNELTWWKIPGANEEPFQASYKSLHERTWKINHRGDANEPVKLRTPRRRRSGIKQKGK